MFAPRLSVSQKSPWRVIRRGIAVLGLSCLFYTLSIGPMFWTWYGARYVGGSRWVITFYAPLQYACEVNPYLGDCVDAYIMWWNTPPDYQLPTQPEQLVAGSSPADKT